MANQLHDACNSVYIALAQRKLKDIEFLVCLLIEAILAFKVQVRKLNKITKPELSLSFILPKIVFFMQVVFQPNKK